MTGKIQHEGCEDDEDMKRIGEVSSDEMIALRPQCIDCIEDLDFALILILILILVLDLMIRIHLLFAFSHSLSRMDSMRAFCIRMR